jgi:hypothetical protein
VNRPLPAALAAAARWLLRAAGKALGAPPPACADQADALRRAARAVGLADANEPPTALGAVPLKVR